MIIKFSKKIFFIIFLGMFGVNAVAKEVTNWEQLYYYSDAKIPNITFNNFAKEEYLENTKFSKYNISRSFRYGKRPVNILIKDNYLYMLDSKNNIIVFSLDSRKVVKKHSLKDYKNVTASGIAISDDNLYITFKNGTLLSYSLSILDINWKVDVVDPINSAPVISDNKVFFVANNTTYAISQTSGTILWNSIGSKSGVSLQTLYAPVLYSGYLFLGLSNSDVIVLRQEQGNIFFKTNIANTGSVSYRINPIMGDIKSPIVPFDNKDGTNILVSSNNRIIMFNLETKEEVWKNHKIGSYSTPIVVGKSILIIDTNGNLVSLNKGTGTVQWQKSLQTKTKTKKRIFWYGPIEVNDNLFIINSVGEIMLVSKVDGEVKSYKRLFSFKKEKVFSPPVITSEYIAIISSYGNLYINKIKK